MTKAVVLQCRLTHYRVRLFELLRKRCAERGIDFHLVHGQPMPRELNRQDTGQLPWADVVRNIYLNLGRYDVVWQPFPTRHRDAGLVVMSQENRLLSNCFWLLFGRLMRTKTAFWGHARNLQSDNPSGLRERWKRAMNRRVDWWFAYTDLTREILLNDGYPAERITVFNNAIDNEGFRHNLGSVTSAQIEVLRSEIDAAEHSPIGLFCGSLYSGKRLDLLVTAADRIHAALPDFRLVIIGDGPSAGAVKAAAKHRAWLKWVGVRGGVEKAAWFRVASVVLNPGAVGLHVLDSFCSGVPMITTTDARHGPEIAYLEHEVNGLIVPAERYAAEVIALLRNESRLETLKKAALSDASRYTLDHMVHRFVEGITQCLAVPKRTNRQPVRPLADRVSLDQADGPDIVASEAMRVQDLQ